jgi:hypothetical protein
MNNERIDLTQFERILNGPWSLVDGNEVLVCPTEECLGWCECGKGVPTKGRWIWQYIIGADIDTGRDLVMATVEQTIDEVMGWDNDGNYNIPPKEEGIAYATAKAVQMLPDLITELKKMYAREDELLNALRIIRDDLDDQPTGPNADLFEHINKIRNFANDASQ